MDLNQENRWLNIISFLFIFSLSVFGLGFDYSKTIVPVLLIFIWMLVTKTQLNYLGLKPNMKIWKIIGLALGAFILTYLIVGLVIMPVVNSLVSEPPDISRFASVKGNTLEYLKYLGVAWFIAGFGEEVIFRGYIMPKIEEFLGKSNWSKIAAVLIATFAFGLAHSYQGISGGLLAGFLGLVFGILYYATKRNLWICIILHGLIDTASMTFLYLG